MKVSDMIWRTMLVLVVAGALACGCGDDDDDEGLYVLSSAVGDPVTVALDDAAGTGTLAFTLTSNPIPNEPSATLLGFLSGGTIALNVANDETGVNFDLTQGVQVTGAPAASGEYSVVDTNGDGTALTITFFNDFNGSTIRADGSYTALVTVSDNQYFLVEEFTRGVTVTE